MHDDVARMERRMLGKNCPAFCSAIRDLSQPRISSGLQDVTYEKNVTYGEFQ